MSGPCACMIAARELSLASMLLISTSGGNHRLAAPKSLPLDVIVMELRRNVTAASMVPEPLPSTKSLVADLLSMAAEIDAVARVVTASETRVFTHPDGRQEALGLIGLTLEQLAIIAFYARTCRTPTSVEIGFGMGTSTLLMLAVRCRYAPDLTGVDHWVFDPYGLPNNQGHVVESYIKAQFAPSYHRVWQPSELGLGALREQIGAAATDLILIDGSHRFEHVLTDFLLSDALCRVGGHIMLDDFAYPAVETAINYLASNRRDYAINTSAADNFAILEKISVDQPSWGEFTPFEVSDLTDWNRRPQTVPSVV